MYIEEGEYHIENWQKILLEMCPGLFNYDISPDGRDIESWLKQERGVTSSDDRTYLTEYLCTWAQGQQFLDAHPKAPEKGWRQQKERF